MKAELTDDAVRKDTTAREGVRGPSEASPEKLRRRLSGDLDTIVLRALNKEPQRRYASVEQFAEDVRRHLEGLPVRARRDSWSYRAGKFVTRHKLAVTATALVLMAVLGGVAATVREARIAAANERRAEQRFNDVRKLANSLMHEIQIRLKAFLAPPGAETDCARSLEIWRRFAEDSSDLSLQAELAKAYERIGRVQGNPEGSNLGEINGAVESSAKRSTSARKTEAAIGKELTDQISLAGSYREMCRINARYLGSIKTGLEYCGKALNIAERLRRRIRDERGHDGMARDYEALGRVYGENSTFGNAGAHSASRIIRRRSA